MSAWVRLLRISPSVLSPLRGLLLSCVAAFLGLTPQANDCRPFGAPQPTVPVDGPAAPRRFGSSSINLRGGNVGVVWDCRALSPVGAGVNSQGR